MNSKTIVEGYLRKNDWRVNESSNSIYSYGGLTRYAKGEVFKDYWLRYVYPEHISQAYVNGDIHIHDLDFFTLTTTCCQIDLVSLFKGGFSTGHGYLREPNDIASYSALACIAIQSNQNDQHGGQRRDAADPLGDTQSVGQVTQLRQVVAAAAKRELGR